MANPGAGIRWQQIPLSVRVVALGLGLNVLTWCAASWWPDASGTWTWVSLLVFFLLGMAIGRWWALLVTGAFAVMHAVPVYLGLLPGYLSTWEEALWWVFALGVLLALTALGVLARASLRKLAAPR